MKSTLLKYVSLAHLLCITFSTYSSIHPEKEWTFIIYMAADNDLSYFAKKNLEELKAIGSTLHINILVQLDQQGAHETTKRFYVEKNNLIQVNKGDTPNAQKLDFGNAQTLIDCFKWGITDYPARHYAFIFWNHGSGILDGIGGKTTNASELFSFNPTTHMLDLNRTLDFLEYAEKREHEKHPRGICFSDTFGSYLTSPKLHYAFKSIITLLPEGKKIDIIGFDACLMSMIEIANLLKPYANIMVASQELELGTGWRYNKVIEPFLQKALTPQEFAQHIVEAYQLTYQNITNDYTLSAVNLDTLSDIETALEKISVTLIEALSHQQNNTVTRLIRASRSKRLCTYFAEPSYIDLHHFLTNLLESIDFMALSPEKSFLKTDLEKSLREAIAAIKKTVIANKTGKNLTGAQGLSIYFPYRFIEQSYHYTVFANSNSWTNFLKTILSL